MVQSQLTDSFSLSPNSGSSRPSVLHFLLFSSVQRSHLPENVEKEFSRNRPSLQDTVLRSLEKESVVTESLLYNFYIYLQP